MRDPLEKVIENGRERNRWIDKGMEGEGEGEERVSERLSLGEIERRRQRQRDRSLDNPLCVQHMHIKIENSCMHAPFSLQKLKIRIARITAISKQM